jgi:hypothetical protein
MGKAQDSNISLNGRPGDGVGINFLVDDGQTIHAI